MQAALCDLAPSRALNPQPFNICQRVLLKCHEIIFADPPPPSSRSPYSPRRISLDGVRALLSPAPDGGGGRQKKKLKVANVEAVILGLGMIAGAVGSERALRDMGEVAVLQGSRGGEPRESLVAPPVENGEGGSGGVDGPTAMGRAPAGDDAAELPKGEQSGEGSAEALQQQAGTSSSSAVPSGVVSPSPAARPTFVFTDDSPDIPLSGNPLARQPSSTSPSLPLAPSLLRQQSTSDPFSELDLPVHTLLSLPPSLRPKPLLPSHSTPSLSSLGTPLPARNDPEELLRAYSPKDQERLLRSHYCRSEVRFLIALEEISNRLLVIPKPARVSALRAELTSLNHMLPAEVRPPPPSADCHSSSPRLSASPARRCACRPGASRTTATRRAARPSLACLSARAHPTRAASTRPTTASCASRPATRSS